MSNEEIIEIIKNKRIKDFREIIESLECVDIAIIIDELDDEYQVLAFRMLPKAIAADVFSYLPSDTQEQIVRNITDKELNNIIEDLYTDDAVDMLDELPATLVKRILQNATQETRKTLNQFLKYPEDSAGSIMTSEYVDLKKNITVAEAIKRIRQVGKDKETIYTCYVRDEKRNLEGVVSVKDLLLAKDEKLVSDIMDTNFIFCHTHDDRESVAKMLQKYDLLALPVVDSENRLVGIITIDDAIDVIQAEAEEDFEKMAAMAPSDKPYFDTSVFAIYTHRILWLCILMVSGLITGLILESFEQAIATVPILVSFLPMLNDTGGNCGTQAATTCIRGLTTGEIQPRQWLKLWWKEFRVALLIASSLAALTLLRILIFTNEASLNGHTKMQAALVICGAMMITIIISKSLGALLPILAKKLKLDPAVCAAPMITTIVDCCAILVYFSLAQMILL